MMSIANEPAHDGVRSPPHRPQSLDKPKEIATQLEDTMSEHEKTAFPEAQNLVYADDEHEPKLHARTWVALIALCTQQFIQSYSILGPPAIVCT